MLVDILGPPVPEYQEVLELKGGKLFDSSLESRTSLCAFFFKFVLLSKCGQRRKYLPEINPNLLGTFLKSMSTSVLIEAKEKCPPGQKKVLKRYRLFYI